MASTVGRLEERAAQLRQELEQKNAALTAALADGKATDRIIGDVARINAELDAIGGAVALVEQRQAELRAEEQRRQAEAQEQQRRAARLEIEKLERQAVPEIVALSATLGRIRGLRQAAPGGPAIISQAFIGQVFRELDQVRQLAPEAMGLLVPTPEELRRKEAEEDVKRAEQRLAALKQARDSNRNQAGMVNPGHIESAQHALTVAKKRLAELQK